MMRQNGGLNGYGLVSGGAIGGLSGGVRKHPLSTNPAAVRARQRRREKKIMEIQQELGVGPGYMKRQLLMTPEAIHRRQLAANRRLRASIPGSSRRY